MPLKVNFSTVGKPIPASIYGAKVVDYKIRDETHAVLNFRITDKSDYEGKRLSKFYQTEGDGAQFLFNDLVVLGADPEDLSPPDAPEGGVDIDVEELFKQVINTNVLLRVTINEYTDKAGNAKVTNNIAGIEIAP